MKQEELFLKLEDVWKDRTDTPMIVTSEQNIYWPDFEKLVSEYEAMIPSGTKRAGLVMKHGPRQIAALFAILKSNAAYIPAEPSFPRERIKFMLEDAAANGVITEEGWIDLHSTKEIIHDGLAYILFTSGSTGMPKGVAIRPENILHYARAFDNEYHIQPGDRMLQYSVCSFDIFTEEVLASLLNGASLAIPSPEEKETIPDLMNFCQKHDVTMLSGFPYLLEDMNHLDSIPSSLRLLVSGGDVLRARQIDHLKNVTDAMIYNTYGPSETTVCCSYQRCDNIEPLEDGTYPIGKPVLGSEIRILDENLQPVQKGETGEICILGGGVGAGYAGNRKKENEAFLETEDGKRLYRSGDLGYEMEDGTFAFIHRRDDQVMILGRRTEPTEIENILLKNPAIRQAFVLGQSDENNLSYLTAYLVFEIEQPVSQVQAHLKEFLPEYMIPEFFVKLESLPLNDNGKVDVQALPKVLKSGL